MEMVTVCSVPLSAPPPPSVVERAQQLSRGPDLLQAALQGPQPLPEAGLAAPGAGRGAAHQEPHGEALGDHLLPEKVGQRSGTADL